MMMTPDSLFEQSKREWLSQVKNQIPLEQRVPDKPFGVWADILYHNDIYGSDGKQKFLIEKLTIVGKLVWNKFEHEINRKALIKIGEKSPLAGVMLGINNRGDILCFAVSTEKRALSHFSIPSKYRQMKKIKKLPSFTAQPFTISPLVESR